MVRINLLAFCSEPAKWAPLSMANDVLGCKDGWSLVPKCFKRFDGYLNMLEKLHRAHAKSYGITLCPNGQNEFARFWPELAKWAPLSIANDDVLGWCKDDWPLLPKCFTLFVEYMGQVIEASSCTCQVIRHQSTTKWSRSIILVFDQQSQSSTWLLLI